MKITYVIPLAAFVAILAGSSVAEDSKVHTLMMSTGLILPEMDAEKGRMLFASKGCVVCHSIQGIGGTDAPPLDAEYMDVPMNPFEFAARMWRGAETMVEMQRDELGGVIELNGQELAAIIAFAHDADEQKNFSEDDFPEEIKMMLSKME